MKKYLIVFFLIFVWASYAQAGVMMWSGGAPAPAAGGPDAWYYSTGSDNYAAHAGETGDYGVGAEVAVTTGGSCTKLAIKVQESDEDDVKLAIYDTSGNRLSSGCTITGSLIDGWNECTLGTPYNVTSSTTYVVVFHRAAYVEVYNAASGTNYYAASTYANFPDSTLSFGTEAGKSCAVRMYVD